VNYLDANFAAALHFDIQHQTSLAEKFVRKNSDPFILSELAELECRRAFLIRTGKVNSENWLRLQSFLEEGTWRREQSEWKPLFDRAVQIMDQFGALRAGTLDTLHVAFALHCGATRFLSFDNDSNARVLAASCRLKVYPDLSALEKGKVRRSSY
jgi:predicted nucleic acid-binding protein